MDQQQKIMAFNYPKKYTNDNLIYSKNIDALVTMRNDQKRFFHYPKQNNLFEHDQCFSAAQTPRSID